MILPLARVGTHAFGLPASSGPGFSRMLSEIFRNSNLANVMQWRINTAPSAESQLFGAQVLNDIASIVTPDTLMAWHSKLIAMTWDHSDKHGLGRPRITSEIAALIVRLA